MLCATPKAVKILKSDRLLNRQTQYLLCVKRKAVKHREFNRRLNRQTQYLLFVKLKAVRPGKLIFRRRRGRQNKGLVPAIRNALTADRFGITKKLLIYICRIRIIIALSYDIVI